MIYASSAAVYGLGNNGFEADPECEKPLNVYGQSKLDFDNYFRLNYDFDTDAQIVGLRYFNVYGPGEDHKLGMASPINQFCRQSITDDEIRLFEGSENFVRDFVHIDDIVKVNMFFFNNPAKVGIYNCGTGLTSSFHEAATIVSEKTGAPLKTIPFPENLKNKYQEHTKANLETLRSIGCRMRFRKFSEAAPEYAEFLVNP